MSTWGTCRPNTRLQANQKGSQEPEVRGPDKDRPHRRAEGPESRKQLCASFPSQGLLHHLPTEAHGTPSPHELMYSFPRGLFYSAEHWGYRGKPEKSPWETEPSGKSRNETRMDNAKCQEAEIKVLGGVYPGGTKAKGPWAVH